MIGDKRHWRIVWTDALQRWGGFVLATWRRRLRLQRGFSAMEMLVVVTLFAIGSLSISSVYLNFTRLHRRVANAEVLGEDMRFLTELIVREFRGNAVEYPTLPAALASPTSSLTLDTPSGGTVIIRKYATSSKPCLGQNGACLALSVDNGATWTPITSRNVAINSFWISLNPTKTPFVANGVGLFDNNVQPAATFLIDASYNVTSTIERVSQRAQTTVSSRVYLR